ncbi:MAG: Formylglycine-rating enzyme family protein [Candidatus Poribacteria bacterium]|nr:Formylglycine-rating enzyme family protein [Candidatus Poribacteria bacterium]
MVNFRKGKIEMSQKTEFNLIRKVLILFSLVYLGIMLIPITGFGEETAAKNDKQVIKGKDGSEMVMIPAGDFQMGSNDGFRRPDEKPVHTVYLNAFYMDKYEVTNAQYRRFVKETGHKEPEGTSLVDGRLHSGFNPWSDERFNKDNQPVVCVSWDDAKAYAEWAGKRLPTEAEWEKAARGGLADKKYVWGNESTPPKGAGNLVDKSTRKVFPNLEFFVGYDDGYTYTAPVGKFKPNGYDLYDMAGNVFEWCADWFDPDYYSKSPKQNPKGPESGEARVLRGGSWIAIPDYLRVAFRWSSMPENFDDSYGFRCVSDVTP